VGADCIHFLREAAVRASALQREVSIRGSCGTLQGGPGISCKSSVSCSVMAEVLRASAPKMCNVNRMSILLFLLKSGRSLADLLCSSPKAFGWLRVAREWPGGQGLNCEEGF